MRGRWWRWLTVCDNPMPMLFCHGGLEVAWGLLGQGSAGGRSGSEQVEHMRLQLHRQKGFLWRATQHGVRRPP